ncbi:hypothetical protein FHT26_001924 [Rhizobacter sp. SG703]|nr:hypothetical protein [Rhizobacter sp. SG703]
MTLTSTERPPCRVVTLNEAGRWAAILLLAVFGSTLLRPGLADRLSRPVVALGTKLKRSLHAGEWLRRAAGVAVLAGVGAIAAGLDTGVPSRLSPAGTTGWEQALVDKVHRPAH